MMSWNGLYLEQMIKIVIATVAKLALNDRRRHRFVVNEKLWGKEVADAALCRTGKAWKRNEQDGWLEDDAGGH